jgi:putative zinc finger/helix-turn-helix YgiT family protein
MPKENTSPAHACPMCGEGSLQPRADRQYVFRYLRRLHTVAGLEHAVCDRCGTSSYLPGQLARNKTRIEQAQREVAGYIGPQDILALRERYGLSQKLAARIFGGGVRAFSKWERGEVRPAEPTAKLMHLALADPGAMRSLVKLAGLDPASDEFSGLRLAEQDRLRDLERFLSVQLGEHWKTVVGALVRARKQIGRERKVVWEEVSAREGPPSKSTMAYQPLPGRGQCIQVRDTDWCKMQMNDEASDATEPAAV